MSHYYRGEEPYGPYKYDWAEADGIVYEEGYSKKPVTSDKRAGDSHHLECPYDDIHLDTCLCFELYNRDCEADKERELEEMHQEWWQ